METRSLVAFNFGGATLVSLASPAEFNRVQSRPFHPPSRKTRNRGAFGSLTRGIRGTSSANKPRHAMNATEFSRSFASLVFPMAPLTFVNALYDAWKILIKEARSIVLKRIEDLVIL